ncbi:MAG: S1/P1 nuclease [Burkholderiales bacterium]|nr:S1/P1 nuclease [Burkholderiales bacterium]
MIDMYELNRRNTLAQRIIAALMPLALLVSALLPTATFAWGAEGHRVTGLVAAELLTPRARMRINDLIPGADLGDIANYMDLNRNTLAQLIPNSDKWHYDNQPVCGSASFEEYCPNGECASARVPVLVKILADFTNPPEIRAMAARFLVHIVGDIHQPLHAADDGDAGANFKNILLPGTTNVRRLHSVWDSEFVRLTLRGSSEREFAQQLVSRYKAKEVREWQKSDIRDWMNESHELSKSVTYAKLPSFVCREAWTATPVELSQAYVNAAIEVIPTQLAKAGTRIAALLNRALDPNPYVEGPAPVAPPVRK